MDTTPAAIEQQQSPLTREEQARLDEAIANRESISNALADWIRNEVGADNARIECFLARHRIKINGMTERTIRDAIKVALTGRLSNGMAICPQAVIWHLCKAAKHDFPEILWTSLENELNGSIKVVSVSTAGVQIQDVDPDARFTPMQFGREVERRLKADKRTRSDLAAEIAAMGIQRPVATLVGDITNLIKASQNLGGGSMKCKLEVARAICTICLIPAQKIPIEYLEEEQRRQKGCALRSRDHTSRIQSTSRSGSRSAHTPPDKATTSPLPLPPASSPSLQPSSPPLLPPASSQGTSSSTTANGTIPPANQRQPKRRSRKAPKPPVKNYVAIVGQLSRLTPLRFGIDMELQRKKAEMTQVELAECLQTAGLFDQNRDTRSIVQAIKDIENASIITSTIKTSLADIVVFCDHFGLEYALIPEKYLHLDPDLAAQLAIKEKEALSARLKEMSFDLDAAPDPNADEYTDFGYYLLEEGESQKLHPLSVCSKARVRPDLIDLLILGRPCTLEEGRKLLETLGSGLENLPRPLLRELLRIRQSSGVLPESQKPAPASETNELRKENARLNNLLQTAEQHNSRIAAENARALKLIIGHKEEIDRLMKQCGEQALDLKKMGKNATDEQAKVHSLIDMFRRNQNAITAAFSGRVSNEKLSSYVDKLISALNIAARGFIPNYLTPEELAARETLEAAGE